MNMFTNCIIPRKDENKKNGKEAGNGPLKISCGDDPVRDEWLDKR